MGTDISNRLDHENIFYKYKIDDPDSLFNNAKKLTELWPKTPSTPQLWGVASQIFIHENVREMGLKLDQPGSYEDKVLKRDGWVFGKSCDTKNLYIPKDNGYKSFVIIGHDLTKVDVFMPTLFKYHEDELYLYILGIIESSECLKLYYHKDLGYVIDITEDNFDDLFCVRYVKR